MDKTETPDELRCDVCNEIPYRKIINAKIITNDYYTNPQKGWHKGKYCDECLYMINLVNPFIYPIKDRSCR
jgi:hypothetical protein